MLKTNFKIAWRNIIKHKIYSFINVLGLALGVCACLVIYLVAHFDLSFDRFHPDKERIYRIIAEVDDHGERHKGGMVPPILPLTARQAITGLESIAAYHLYSAKISIPANDNPGVVFDNRTGNSSIPATIITEPQYFTIFNYEWLAGTAATSLNTPFKVVLSERKARKYFGDAPFNRIVGKEIIYNDSLRVTVSGIVRDWKANTDFPFDEFISFCTIKAGFLKNAIHLDNWGNADIPWTSRAFVKLDKGVQAIQVDAELAALGKGRIDPGTGPQLTYSLQALSDIHFDATVEDGLHKVHLPTLYALMGIAIFILLLAVINFVNLSTALSIQRAKEVAIRKILGSSRLSLVFQFLTETAILTSFAVLVSLLAVRPVLYLFHSFIPDGLNFSLFNASSLLFLLMISLATSLLSGLYPGKILSSYLPVLCLKGGEKQKTGENRLVRKGLIVFQFTISLVFIISTVVVDRQINYMRNEELGFSTDAILSLQTDPGDTTQKPKILTERIRQLAGVSLVARQSFSPTTELHTMIPVQYRGKHVKEIPAALQTGDENFMLLYQMKLLAGINIRRADSLKEFVINESLSKALGFSHPEEAVGKSLYLGGRPLPIIGVVADFHEYSYHEPIKPLVIANIPGSAEPGIAVKLATQGKRLINLKAVLSQIEQRWKDIYPNDPFYYTFLDDSIALMYEKEQQTAFLMNTAMTITIFLSCMGLFGLVMFTAKQRTKEIGIRKVLGASGTDIAILLSKNFVVLIVIAIVIASPIAWYFMNLWLQNFAYRIDISWWVFAMAGLTALLIAMLTISYQTIKIAMANPVESLRAD